MKKLTLFILLFSAVSAPACMDAGVDSCVSVFTKLSHSQDKKIQANALRELAVISLEKGDNDSVIKTADYLLSQDPYDRAAILMKGWALLGQEKYKKASQAFESMFEVSSDTAAVVEARLGDALSLMGQKNYNAALPVLQDLYSKDPYHISLSAYLLGRAHEETGRLSTAMTYYQQAVLYDYRNYLAQQKIAELSEEADQPVAAWQGYAALLELDPKDEVLTAKMRSLSKKIKGDVMDYLYYTRLRTPMEHAPRVTPSQPVRVGLFSNKSGDTADLLSFEITSSTGFIISDKRLGTVAQEQPQRVWTVQFDPQARETRVLNAFGNLEYKTAGSFKIRPADPGTVILVKNARGDSIIGRDYGDRELRGELTVHASTAGLELINTLPVEDFLPGALTAARRECTQLQALKAAAVVLRTKALALAARNAEAHFDFADSSAGLEYRGASYETGDTVEAADQTRGELLPDNVRPEAAMHTACGGETSAGVSDSDLPPYAVATPLDFAELIAGNAPAHLLCAPSDQTAWADARWTTILDADAIARRADRDYKTGRLRTIEVIRRSGRGAAIELRITGSRKTADITDPTAILAVLSAGAMRSTVFELIPLKRGGKPYLYIARGIGTGSGAGLCLHGADGMSAEGADYKQILQHYFPAPKKEGGVK